MLALESCPATTKGLISRRGREACGIEGGFVASLVVGLSLRKLLALLNEMQMKSFSLQEGSR